MLHGNYSQGLNPRQGGFNEVNVEVISSSASSESDLNEEEVRAREWHRPTERPLMRLIGGDRGGGRP